MKVALLRIIYEATEDVLWRNKLFDFTRQFAKKEETNSSDIYPNVEFWDIIGQNFGRDENEKKELIIFLAGLIRQFNLPKEHTQGILFAITTNWPYREAGIELALKVPNDFCLLIEKTRNIVLDRTVGGYIENGGFYFLERCAPVAFVCIMSEIMEYPERISGFQRNELLGQTLSIIEKNKNILSNPTDVTSAKSWGEWRKTHTELLNIVQNISSYNNKPDILKKIIGKNYE